MDFKHQNFVTFGALRERLFYFLPLCICEMLLGMPSCCPSNTGIKLFLASGCIHINPFMYGHQFKQK